MFLLILESLGSTELVFILVMALVFFGPRKLPQLSRTMGKHLAEFRRASEDFKRTWDREVTLEETSAQNSSTSPTIPEESSIWDAGQTTRALQPPTIEAVPADRVIPRQAIDRMEPVDLPFSEDADSNSAHDLSSPIDQPETPRKRDWL